MFGTEAIYMCYNCGCQMPNNDMGKAENITNQTFGVAARANGMTRDEARKNAKELLEKVLASPAEGAEKDWKPSRA